MESLPQLVDINSKKVNKSGGNALVKNSHQSLTVQGYNQDIDSKSKEDDKSYADIRIKMGTRKSPGKAHHSLNPAGTSGKGNINNDIDSIPSEIGEDMWGEIPKY